ncbi:hypothetical protein JCM10020v2_007766 [Rhodotorula toruloides]
MRRPTSSGADSHLSSSTAATSLPDLEEEPVPTASKLLPPIVLEEAHPTSESMAQQVSSGGYSDLSWDEDWEFPRPSVPELAALSFSEPTSSLRTPQHGDDPAASPSAQAGGWLDPEGMGEDEREYLGVLSSRGESQWMRASQDDLTTLSVTAFQSPKEQAHVRPLNSRRSSRPPRLKPFNFVLVWQSRRQWTPKSPLDTLRRGLVALVVGEVSLNEGDCARLARYDLAQRKLPQHARIGAADWTSRPIPGFADVCVASRYLAAFRFTPRGFGLASSPSA